MDTLVTDEFEERPDEDPFDAHFRWYNWYYSETQKRARDAMARAGSFGGRNA